MSNRINKQSPCRRKVKVSLTPIPQRNFYLPLSKDENELLGSIEAVEKEVLGVINEVEGKIAYLKANPRKFYSPEPAQFRLAGLRHNEYGQLESRRSPLKLSGQAIEQKMQKFSSRKNSIVRLMQSTNSFNLPKQYRDNLMNKLVKQIDKHKKPCIQGLFSEIIQKESLFSMYKQRDNNKNSPNAAFCQACDDEKSAPLPLLKHQQDSSLVLNRYNLSKGLASALARAASYMPYLKSIHLDENGLTDQGGSEILKGIISHGGITSFLYTHNDIGVFFLKQFEILAKLNFLKELNFKGCKVSGQNLNDLISNLKLFKYLKKLTLSELTLSSLSIEKLARVLEKSKIMYLDLSWNSICQEASITFFEGLYSNTYLKFLDYSWNPLNDEDQLKALSKLIKVHPSLMHLNLSYCQITEISGLMSSLKFSESLIGLHLTGNNIDSHKLPANSLPKLYSNSAVFLDMPGKAVHELYNLKQRDNNGRLVLSHNDCIVNTISPKKNVDKLLLLEPKEVIISRVIGQPELKAAENWGVSEHCWICERWGVYHLKVTLDSLQQVASPDIFYSRTITGCKLVMKPSFNNWKDLEFEVLDEGKGEYELNVLIPPGKHRFLIICDDRSVCVTRKISTSKWKKLLVNEFTMPLRELEISLNGEMTYAISPVFEKNKSFFRYFLEDSETILKACLDQDLKHIKVHRIIRESAELNKTLDILSVNYFKLKSIYFDLMIHPTYPVLEYRHLIEFCKKLGVLTEDFPIFKLESLFEQSFGDKFRSEVKYNRHHFIELILRLSQAKYLDLELPSSTKLSNFLNQYVFANFQFSRPSRFRKEKLYNLEVNEILEKNTANLQSLLNKYKDESGRWLSFPSAITLLSSVGWSLQFEDLLKSFAYSKMTIIDESNLENTYDKLQFIEMVEFLCRVIDLIANEDQTLDQKLLNYLQTLLIKNKIKFTQKIFSQEILENNLE